MKFNFKKIASVLASAVMIGSTVGLAAAANYPAPFIAGGSADVAVVVGSSAATSDFLAAADLGSNLQAELAKQATTGTTGGSITGEAGALFTGGSKIYVNDTINLVKSTMTKTELPTVLKDGDFNGNVDTTYTQTIVLGSTPKLVFDKQPTSSTDPAYGFSMSTSTGSYTYNATVTFNTRVNFTHADSKNTVLTLFGQKFTIGAGTDNDNLVLFKESSSLYLDSTGTTSEEVTISGKKYTVELVSASTTSAIVKVTDESGTAEQKEVTEGYSKKINGITVAVNTADSNNQKYVATVIAGAERFKFSHSNAVTFGDQDTAIDGTKVTFSSASLAAGTTTMRISATAPNSDNDAILPGKAFVDPVFGTFKIDFSGLNIAEDSETARETMKVYASGDDKMLLDMTDYNGNAKAGIQWAYNATDAIKLQWDDNGHNIIVSEMASANRSDYIVLGNEAEGHLVKVSTITNQTTGYSNDAVKFTDIFTGDTYSATLTEEGAGTVTIGGKVYTVYYYGSNDLSDDSKYIKLQYPDSSAAGDMVIWPTISTSKGAKLMFYKPLTIDLNSYDGLGADATTLKIPNGANAYKDITTALAANGGFTIDSTVVNSTATNPSKIVALTGTGFSLNFTYSTLNTTVAYLMNPAGGNLIDPALVLLEEKDDNSVYHGLVVTLEAGKTSEDGIGVEDVYRSWLSSTSTGSSAFRNTLASDSKKTREADLYGTIVTLDASDSDQKKVEISYPDEQIYAQVYIAAESAAITAGETGTGVSELGSVTVKDTEISLVQSKNLIVVGGSCINSVAAKIIGGALCDGAFTTSTGIGADQALIKVVKNPYLAADTNQIAMLVAGFEAADTTKAAKYLMTSKPSTIVGEIKLSTSGTVATVATTTA